MKHIILIFILVCSIAPVNAQYYYPYDNSNFYFDDAPDLIIQKDRIMGWYVSDLD